MENRKSVYGDDVGEYCHIYIKNEELPFTFIGIGTTYPNKKYFIHRKSVEYYDIEYISRGKGYVSIGGEIQEVEEGDIFIIEPGLEHSYYPDTQDPFEKTWVAFTSDSFDAIIKSLRLNGVFVFRKKSNLKRLFEEIIMIGSTSSCSDDVQFKLGLLVNEIAYSLGQPKKEEELSELSKNIKDMLDDSILKTITLKEIANKLNYSVKQIGRAFAKSFGITPHKYLLNCKIEASKTLLISTNISIAEIAKSLHFSNQNSFSNAFKQKTGLSPTAFRASN